MKAYRIDSFGSVDGVVPGIARRSATAILTRFDEGRCCTLIDVRRIGHAG
jgi:hypothetical protein